MQLAHVGEGSVHKGDTCKECLKALKVGDAIAWCKTDSFTKHRFSIHITCMARLVFNAGKKFEYNDEYEAVRNRIIETGNVWA